MRTPNIFNNSQDTVTFSLTITDCGVSCIPRTYFHGPRGMWRGTVCSRCVVKYGQCMTPHLAHCKRQNHAVRGHCEVNTNVVGTRARDGGQNGGNTRAPLHPLMAQVSRGKTKDISGYVSCTLALCVSDLQFCASGVDSTRGNPMAANTRPTKGGHGAKSAWWQVAATTRRTSGHGKRCHHGGGWRAATDKCGYSACEDMRW